MNTENPEPIERIERIIQINLGGTPEDQGASLDKLREFMDEHAKESEKKHWLRTGIGGVLGFAAIGITASATLGVAVAIGVAVYRYVIGLIG